MCGKKQLIENQAQRSGHTIGVRHVRPQQDRIRQPSRFQGGHEKAAGAGVSITYSLLAQSVKMFTLAVISSGTIVPFAVFVLAAVGVKTSRGTCAAFGDVLVVLSRPRRRNYRGARHACRFCAGCEQADPCQSYAANKMRRLTVKADANANANANDTTDSPPAPLPFNMVVTFDDF